MIVVAQAPIPNGNPINCIERTWLTGRDASECAATSAARAELDSNVKQLLQSATESETNVKIVFPFERLCDAQACRIFTEQGDFVYMDEAHLSAAGAQFLSAGLEASMLASAREAKAQ